MEYDSYRFDSKRWALSAHHFCKVDTWLEGVIEPQHPELWAPAKDADAVDACDNSKPNATGISCGQENEQEGEAGDLE